MTRAHALQTHATMFQEHMQPFHFGSHSQHRYINLSIEKVKRWLNGQRARPQTTGPWFDFWLGLDFVIRRALSVSDLDKEGLPIELPCQWGMPVQTESPLMMHPGKHLNYAVVRHVIQ